MRLIRCSSPPSPSATPTSMTTEDLRNKGKSATPLTPSFCVGMDDLDLALTKVTAEDEGSCDASAEEDHENEISDTDSVPSHNVTLTSVPDHDPFEVHRGFNGFNGVNGGFVNSSPMKEQQTDISEAELSDFWDQEKYLSEHNYDEEAIDEDTARRLLNFGDDYRNFIDSLSEGPSSFPESQGTRCRKNRKKNKDTKDPDCESLSDVEIHNTNDILQRSEVKYCNVKKQVLKKQVFSETKHALGKLVETCQENIALITFLADRKNQSNPKYKKAVRHSKTLRKKWSRLLEICEMKVRLFNKLEDIEGNIKGCREKINSILETECSDKPLSDLEKDILTCQAELALTKASIETLEELKDELFHINLETHNLNAETHELFRKVGFCCDDVSSCSPVDHENPVQLQSVQEAVITLYEMWDDALYKKKKRLMDVENAMEHYSKLQKAVLDQAQQKIQSNGKSTIIADNKLKVKSSSKEVLEEMDMITPQSSFLRTFLVIQALLTFIVLVLVNFDQPSCCDGHSNFAEYGLFHFIRSQERPPL